MWVFLISCYILLLTEQYLLLGSIKYGSTNFHYKYIPTLPDMYLAKSLLTVTTHPSLTRARNTNGTWVSYTPSISTPALAGFELTPLVVIGTDCIGSCKSNYHAIRANLYLILLQLRLFSFVISANYVIIINIVKSVVKHHNSNTNYLQ
jgi:hypothetical protein